MRELLPAGKYVVAVSGGVDSVVLLHMLQGIAGFKLTVAHFDHGIREDSGEDAAFVAGLAGLYGLEFEGGVGRLGAGASEDTARHHRYAFLKSVQARHKAQAIVTAHHQDDVIETALLNVMRGTKRRGLVSLRSNDELNRPLLHITKDEIRSYAVTNNLEWVEDSTNQEMKYARNRVRAQLYKYLTTEKRDRIALLLHTIDTYNSQINSQINEILMKHKQQVGETGLIREDIATVNDLVSAEIIAAWLRANEAVFDKKTIERVQSGSKELQNGAKIDIDKQYYCLLTKHEIVLKRRESV